MRWGDGAVRKLRWGAADTSTKLRMLTPSEIALLRQIKQEIAQRVAEVTAQRKG